MWRNRSLTTTSFRRRFKTPSNYVQLQSLRNELQVSLRGLSGLFTPMNRPCFHAFVRRSTPVADAVKRSVYSFEYLLQSTICLRGSDMSLSYAIPMRLFASCRGRRPTVAPIMGFEGAIAHQHVTLLSYTYIKYIQKKRGWSHCS